ncbi:MAG: methyltransferase domain-containing protein, partial [Chloroflexi bacterium]|nr:methyltransferase domain-containing protein [Chloroflexota bacterium]
EAFTAGAELVRAREQLESVIRGRLVFVGWNATGSASDFYPTVVEERTPGVVVFDLGSGDGRVVIAAAQRYGARGVGVEINPVWVLYARRDAEQAGVTDRVTFRIDDLFAVDLREATVVTLYLLPWMNRKLAPRFRAELRPGTRIVSHEYGIGDWPPDHSEEMIVNGERHAIHVWTVR